MENNELIEKARAAKSAEELMAIAKENGMEMTEEEAAEYFAQLNRSGELSDDELDSVAGGGCHKKDGRMVVSALYGCDEFVCKICGKNYTEDHTHSRTLPNGAVSRSNITPICDHCKHVTYEGGLWLCNNPNKMK